MRAMIFALLFSVGLSVAAPAEVRYRAVPIGDIPGPPGSRDVSRPWAINEFGNIAADGFGASGSHAVFWSPETALIDLGSFWGGGYQSHANGLNNLGHVVGHSQNLEGCRCGPFLWKPETGMVSIGTLSGYDGGVAYNINDLDQVVGYCTGDGNVHTEAFFWSAETGFIGLGDMPGGVFFSIATDINNSGLVVGSASPGGDSEQVFLWDQQNGMRLLGRTPDGTLAIGAGGLNELGQIAGDLSGPNAFFWDPVEGFIVIEPFPGDTVTNAWGLNDRGDVVGVSFRPPYFIHPWIWDSTNGLRDIRDLMDPCFVDDWPVDGPFPTDINNAGQITLNTGELGLRLDPYLLADLNVDGVVSVVDLALLLSNFGRSGDATYAQGDLDCNARVDLQDLSTLLANFGATGP